MGWVKKPVKKSEQIYIEIISEMPTWKGVPSGNGSAYEYLSDYIRDYYDVTMKQCEEICEWLREYYNIKKFYATD